MLLSQCPEVEPSCSTYCRICNGCQVVLSKKQTAQFQLSNSPVDVPSSIDKTSGVNGLLSLHQEFTALETKIEVQLPKVMLIS